MKNADSLIPTRFLVLLAHLSISIVILWSRDANVLACLPYDYKEDDYYAKDQQLMIGLILALALIGIELIGFLSGTSMFFPSVATLSIGCHFCACVLLSYLFMDSWDCTMYWWIFVFSSILPGIVEVCVVFNVHVLKRI